MQKHKKKTVWFDIETEAKVHKMKKKFPKMTESRIVRTAIRMTPFEDMVEHLNRELGIIK